MSTSPVQGSPATINISIQQKQGAAILDKPPIASPPDFTENTESLSDAFTRIKGQEPEKMPAVDTERQADDAGTLNAIKRHVLRNRFRYFLVINVLPIITSPLVIPLLITVCTAPFFRAPYDHSKFLKDVQQFSEKSQYPLTKKEREEFKKTL